ncbi:MAG: hypothetical protein LH632_03670 [Rhodoferax sp.]|nr:hypothetical protein [Rhodoferax sp.]
MSLEESATAFRGAMPVSGQALAQGHVEAFGQAVPLDGGEGFLGGAGGLVTTADDLDRWLAFPSVTIIVASIKPRTSGAAVIDILAGWA